MKHQILFLLFLSLCFLIACNEDGKSAISVSEDAFIQSYLDTLDFDITTSESGLKRYPILLDANAKTQLEGNVLTFFYQLSVLGGSIVDVRDSLDSDTIVVKQGANAIYPIGIDEALSFMKEGEKWGFVLPSSLAFGDYSFSTLIPKNAILLADIELLKIRSEDDVLEEELDLITAYVENEALRDTVTNPLNLPVILNNGMVVKRLKEGMGRPNPGQLMESSYTASFLDKEIFQSASKVNPFEFFYGETGVIPGFDDALNRMEFGERLLAIMPSYLGYRESAQVIPPFLTEDMIDLEIVPGYSAIVSPYKPLVFEIELIPADSIN